MKFSILCYVFFILLFSTSFITLYYTYLYMFHVYFAQVTGILKSNTVRQLYRSPFLVEIHCCQCQNNGQNTGKHATHNSGRIGIRRRGDQIVASLKPNWTRHNTGSCNVKIKKLKYYI